MFKRITYFFTGILFAAAAIIAANYLPVANAIVPGTNTLVSVNNTGNGQGGNQNSPGNTTSLYGGYHISANGRYVVFTSNATNIVSGDTNGYRDVFVRDLENGTTERVNISSNGVQANYYISYSSNEDVAISSDGRYVVFPSLATNLIDGRTSPAGQIYIRDRVAGTTTMVSQLSDGTPGTTVKAEAKAVSSDGRFVTFVSNVDTVLTPSVTNTQSNFVYVADLNDRSFQILNPTPATGQYRVSGVAASCDGSIITFSTNISLLGEDTDSAYDIYISDLRNGYELSGLTTSINTTYSTVLPSISCNGDFITFRTNDTAFTTHTVSGDHIYLYDRVNDYISLVDVTAAGAVNNQTVLSKSGVDDKGNVSFISTSTNLAGFATYGSQVFLKHKDSGSIELVSIPVSGAYSNGAYGTISISADGSGVVYSASTSSVASNLISSDTNGYMDVFHSLTGL